MLKLTSAQQTAIKLYKGNNSFLEQPFFTDYLNTCLSEHQTLPNEWEAQAIELDSLIRESLLPSPMLLYRAMLDEYLVHHIVDSNIFYPAYMSTAVEEHAVSRHFSTSSRGTPAALLRIQCDAGAPAFDMEGNEGFGGGMEQEVLLPRGAIFLIEGIEEVTNRECISAVMTPLYANNYSMLKIYQLKYVT